MTYLDRRTFLQLGALGLAGCALPRTGSGPVALPLNRPLPTPAQLQWHRDELAIFLYEVPGANCFEYGTILPEASQDHAHT